MSTTLIKFGPATGPSSLVSARAASCRTTGENGLKSRRLYLVQYHKFTPVTALSADLMSTVQTEHGQTVDLCDADQPLMARGRSQLAVLDLLLPQQLAQGTPQRLKEKDTKVPNVDTRAPRLVSSGGITGTALHNQLYTISGSICQYENTVIHLV